VKKQTEKVKPDPMKMKSTVWMDRAVWAAARHAALDRGVSFGKLVEDALRAHLGVKP
jgi:hypothetical protein